MKKFMYLEREKRRRGEAEDLEGRANGGGAVKDFGALDLRADLIEDTDDL